LTGTPVTHGRHLMIANSASDIAIETVHLLRNAGARDRLSAEARRLIETEYSWRRIAGMFVREWEAGLHQPNHGNKLAQESSVNHTKPAIKDLD